MHALPADFINLSRYPLDCPESAVYDKLVSDARLQLDETSICVLPEFLHENAVRLARQGVRAMEHQAELRQFQRTPYVFDPPTDNEPLDSPRRHEQEYCISYLYGEQISASQAIRTVYQWDPLLSFLSTVVEHRLFPTSDEGDESKCAYNQPP